MGRQKPDAFTIDPNEPATLTLLVIVTALTTREPVTSHMRAQRLGFMYPRAE